jgi:transmembrane sensor
MPNRPNSSPHPVPDSIREQAAAWLARRDRGLSAAEQDDYMQWLGQDVRHAEAIGQHAATLERMMQLYEWQPAHDTEPNPDLFAPHQHIRWRSWTAGMAAAAALLVIAYLAVGRAPVRETTVAAAPKSHLRVNERLALPDGSRIELKDGSQVVVLYSETERRVKLTGGEAHFTVWKDASRPFVVDAAGVEVRAIGTAFNVRLDEKAIEVLVTEGKVQVENTTEGEETAVNHPAGADNGPSGELPQLFVSKGERAVVPLMAAEAVATVVTPVSAEDISQELAWQAPRLQFKDTPLADAVTEFNRLNRHQLVIGDPKLESLLIGGTFRPDNVEGFIRLLDTTLGIRADNLGDDRTVLRRRR